MLQLQWAHNSVGDTSKSRIALKKRSNDNKSRDLCVAKIDQMMSFVFKNDEFCI